MPKQSSIPPLSPIAPSALRRRGRRPENGPQSIAFDGAKAADQLTAIWRIIQADHPDLPDVRWNFTVFDRRRFMEFWIIGGVPEIAFNLRSIAAMTPIEFAGRFLHCAARALSYARGIPDVHTPGAKVPYFNSNFRDAVSELGGIAQQRAGVGWQDVSVAPRTHRWLIDSVAKLQWPDVAAKKRTEGITLLYCRCGFHVRAPQAVVNANCLRCDRCGENLAPRMDD